MTHPEQIMRAVAVLLARKGHTRFARKDVRLQAGIDSADWNASYNPTFQGMRADQPGGAPVPGKRFQGVFQRVGAGVYTLTEKGRQIVEELRGAHHVDPEEPAGQNAERRLQAKIEALEKWREAFEEP